MSVWLIRIGKLAFVLFSPFSLVHRHSNPLLQAMSMSAFKYMTVYHLACQLMSANVEEQLARIYGRLNKSEEDRGLNLHHVPVQQQSAWHYRLWCVCSGICIPCCNWRQTTFDKGRKHLLHCFEKKNSLGSLTG